MKRLRLCKCGCGGFAKIGRKFIWGHQNRGRKRPDMVGENNPSKLSYVRKIQSEANSGEKNPGWKGGRAKSGGYITILVPDHPFADVNGRVKEERLVMEKHLGRYLSKEEIVHHKDGTKDNNKIENLKLFKNTKEHLCFHRCGKPLSKETKAKISEANKKHWEKEVANAA